MTSRASSRRVVLALRHLTPGGSQDVPADAPTSASRWPAAVLGRCTVLRAHELAGARALRPVVASDGPTVRLWRRALADVLSWDAPALTAWLFQPRGVALSCSGAVHQVVLDADGPVLLQHPDRTAEQVAVALGAPPVSCLTAWNLLKCSSSHDEAGHCTPVDLLCWLMGVRAWSAAGHPPADSDAVVRAGHTPTSLGDHLAAGFSPEEAAAWRGCPADDAFRWRLLEATSAQVWAWVCQGRSLEQAERGAASTPGGWPHLHRWAEAAGGRLDERELVQWAGSGYPLLSWGGPASRGVTVDVAQTWRDAGFGPVEVLRYHHVRVDVAEAVRWRCAGLSAREAVEEVVRGAAAPAR